MYKEGRAPWRESSVQGTLSGKGEYGVELQRRAVLDPAWNSSREDLEMEARDPAWVWVPIQLRVLGTLLRLEWNRTRHPRRN